MCQEFISGHRGKTAIAAFQRRKLRLRGFGKLPRCTAGERRDRKARPSRYRTALGHRLDQLPPRVTHGSCGPGRDTGRGQVTDISHLTGLCPGGTAAVLGTAGCSAAPRSLPTRCQDHLTSSYDTPKCPQTPSVTSWGRRWGQNHPS